MGLALPVIRMQRKEVRNMKLAASFLAALLLTSTLGTLHNAIAEDGILSKDSLTSDPYCHLKFPAIQPGTLDDSQPVLQDPNTGEVIDFYGPCDENPVGKDQIQEQKLEAQHRFEQEYED
jgi:hypothetical protein